MSQRQGVRIVRSQYTRRDILESNRYNLVLELEAKVPDNSYILICGSETEYVEAKAIKTAALNLADEIIRAPRLTSSMINSLLSKYKLSGSIKQVTKNIKIAGQLVIPASSFKGTIRSRLEYKFVVKDGVTYSCYSIIGLRQTLSKNSKHVRFWGDDILYIRQPCNLNVSTDVCRVCDIFGAPGLSSRIDIADLKPTGTINLRSIKLFNVDYEVIPPNMVFTFDVTCRNFSIEDLGLLLASMEVFTRSPIIIGRFKYRYNPVVGMKYADRYYFGLLKIDMKNVKYVYPKWEYKSVNEIIKASRDAIDHYVREGYLDLNKGVIKI